MRKMKTNTRTTLWVMLICTPVGWVWGLIHCQIGEMSGWIFPSGSWFGIEFCGMILEDWLFYPITGYFFIQLILFDPLKRMWGRHFPLKRLSRKSENRVKWLLYIGLCVMIGISGIIFELSGQLTACIFGIPSAIILIFIWKQWDIYHFLRTGIVVVPMEFTWDHVAVGVFDQWKYLLESGIWSDFWINGIPCEMSPGLGVFSTYFIYSMVIFVKKNVTNCMT